MKAIVYQKYGSPEVLCIKDINKPVPKTDEILIQVSAVEATKSDCEMRSFNFAVKWFWLPLRLVLGIFKPRRQVLGSYFSGTIVATGSDVSQFTVGEDVFGCAGLKLGAYAEYICLPASYTLVKKPSTISFEQAAAIPLGGLNALHYLQRAKIKVGDKVLINGAGASIGTFGLQIAKNMGAEVTVVDSGIKENILRKNGTDHFINYEKVSFEQCEQSFDVIFDMVANSHYSKCIQRLKPGGRYLMANPTLIKMLRSVITTKLTDKTVLFAFAQENNASLKVLSEMVEQGKLTPVIDQVLNFKDVIKAHELVESEQRLGIIILSMT